jgi:hypothetical protein
MQRKARFARGGLFAASFGELPRLRDGFQRMTEPRNTHPPRESIVRPERPHTDDPAGDTPDQDGIEIDNAIERPQDGQPGQPGAKTD